jgi:hypothetical protein
MVAWAKVAALRSTSAKTSMGKTEPARFSADETFDVGMDTSSPVSNRLQIAERVYGQTWESRFATFAYEECVMSNDGSNDKNSKDRTSRSTPQHEKGVRRRDRC